VNLNLRNDPTKLKILEKLACLEFWIVTPLVAASVITSHFLPAAVGFATFFWILRWIARGKPSYRTPADWAILLLAVMIPVTLWATALPEKTIPQAWRLLAGIALYYAVVNWANTFKRLRWLGLGLMACGLILAIIAPISVEWSVNKSFFIPDKIYKHLPLLARDTIHPNVMAGNLTLLIPLPLSWLLLNKNRKLWWISVLATIILLAMLVILALTKSRGAWLALGVVLVSMLLIRWRRAWIGVAVCGVIISIFIIPIGLKPMVEALMTSSNLSTLEGRQEVWSRALYMIQDFAFTGVGLGTFEDVADAMYPFFLSSPGSIHHAHNLFLQIAVDLGIPGLIAWLAVLSVSFVSAWQLYRYGLTSMERDIAILGFALLYSQVGLIVHGLTDSVTWGMVKIAPLVWVLWGVTAAGVNLCINE
jgi:putative inorganic carbon (HCO3(-)) transporter